MTHPCPRMAEVGHGSKSPFKLPTDSKWRDNNTCSWCGGLNPDVALNMIENGAIVGPTDKNYKIYVDDMKKVYFQHFENKHKDRFIMMLNDNKINFDSFGGFYVLPYFVMRITGND